MASQPVSPTSFRHKPVTVQVPDLVATEADEGQTGANSLLAAQASAQVAAKRSQVSTHGSFNNLSLNSICC